MSTLKGVLELQRKQNSRQSEIKRYILNKIGEKVNHMANHGELKCVYSIPPLIVGYPRYDIEDTRDFVFKSLEKEGYFVIKIHYDKIFISWDINDINSIKKIKDKGKREVKSLMPILKLKD